MLLNDVKSAVVYKKMANISTHGCKTLTAFCCRYLMGIAAKSWFGLPHLVGLVLVVFL